MTERFRHPGYDPPDFAGHWNRHQDEMKLGGPSPSEITFDNEHITSCSICDPIIDGQRYLWDKQVERDEIEAPLLARIAELEAQLGVKP